MIPYQLEKSVLHVITCQIDDALPVLQKLFFIFLFVCFFTIASSHDWCVIFKLLAYKTFPRSISFYTAIFHFVSSLVLLPTTAETLGIANVDYYWYLNQSGTYTVDGTDDKKEFNDTMVQ